MLAIVPLSLAAAGLVAQAVRVGGHVCAEPAPRAAVVSRSPVAEFGGVAGVTELHDGTLVVADHADRRIVVLAPDGSRRTYDASGDGPAEFRVALPMHLIHRDTAAMFVGRSRWLAVTRASMTALSAVPVATGTWVIGADTVGRLLVEGTTSRTTDQPGPQRPYTPLTLVSRRSGALAQSVGDIAGARVVRRRLAGAAGVTSVVNLRAPLDAVEEARLAPDGWVAIARASPFRIDWLAPTGTRTLGAPIGVPSVRVSAAHRRAVIDGGRTAGPTTTAFDTTLFPAVLPPFEPGALAIAPSGDAIIRLSVPPGVASVPHLVVDRRGRAVACWALPASERIVGRGRSAVYVVTTDADGLQSLFRRPWPARRQRAGASNAGAGVRRKH
jgi:hypothetical protein